MTELNTIQILEELKKFPDVVKWDIDGFLKKAVIEHFKKQAYIKNNKEIIRGQNITESIKLTEQEIIKIYGSFRGLDIFNHYESFNNYFAVVDYDEKNGILNLKRYRDYFIDSLLDLIGFVKSGAFCEDYKEIHEFLEKEKQKNEVINRLGQDSTPQKFNYLNCNFHIFKNGKIKIQGITPRDYSTIKNGFKFFDDVRHNNNY